MRLRSRRVRASTTGSIAAALVAALLVPIATASPLSAQPTTSHGRVLTGATALEGFDVTLYATSGGGGPPDTLAMATSAADGTFDLSYDVPASPGAVLYLLASNTTPPPGPWCRDPRLRSRPRAHPGRRRGQRTDDRCVGLRDDAVHREQRHRRARAWAPERSGHGAQPRRPLEWRHQSRPGRLSQRE
jgi:hypothetical protein